MGMEARAERMEGQVSEEGKLEQDFKGSCSRKLNPGLRSLAMVRNKGKCEERQDELEMVGKRIQKKWHESSLYIQEGKQIKRWKMGAQSEEEESRERK